MSRMKRIFDFMLISSSSFAIIITIINLGNFSSGYEYTVLLQPLFLMLYLIFIRQILFKTNLIITYLFLGISFIRYIFGPLLISITGVGESIPYFQISEESLKLALFLMMWEMVALNICFYIFAKYFVKRIKEKDILPIPKLLGNQTYYIFIILMGLIVFILFGYGENLVNFIVITVQDGRHGDLDDTRLVLIRQILISAVAMAFLLIIMKLFKLYSRNHNKLLYYLAVAASFVHIGIIIGERRSIQLYTAFVSIFLLTTFFKKYKKNTIITILSFAFLVFMFMSIYKFNSAFLYNSYSEALVENEVNIKEYSGYVQAYFQGVQNVGVTINMKDSVRTSLFQVLYDHGRSFFGINFMLKGLMPTTSDLFNTFIYGRYMPSGHVISGIGYGYINLGFLLAPLFVILNLLVAFFCEFKMKTVLSLEMRYIYSYIFIRFIISLFSSTPPLINIATILLGTLGLIYLVAEIFNLPSKKRHKFIIRNKKVFSNNTDKNFT
ncbi:hypothetical protein [Planomicrobium sp. Y74]|uniref:hypothetical protein n=1 Tax=Planomicrobium sp. Y74 TaxID=2478977 RepID=UPI000F274922|nr:hypothetical protein [Planomicrobium sp. Y74]RLQ86714.1 hypothetical protein D9754_14945 [Planomicrobium sp. Y74]